MKNIAFYNSGTMQLDAISMDRSLHTSANGQFFREDVTLNFSAIADQNGRGMDFSLNMSGNFHSPFASNFANDCDGGADRRNLVRRFGSLRGYDWRGLKLLDGGRGSIVFGWVVFALSKHIVLLLWHVGVERSKRSNGAVDAVETVPKMAEHFPACRSSRRCDIVYTDFLADQRYHLAMPCGRGVWQIADIDWQ